MTHTVAVTVVVIVDVINVVATTGLGVTVTVGLDAMLAAIHIQENETNRADSIQ